jgi:hypothetical protein
MTEEKSTKVDKKAKLFEQLKDIQSKIDNLENKRSEKIIKLAKKFNLLDLSDKIIASEFELIKQKYSSKPSDDVFDADKKN